MQRFGTGEDTDASYYAYSATLRIHGQRLPLDEITQRMGNNPTHIHRKGDRRASGALAYPTDAWHLTAPVAEETELTEHLRALWNMVKGQVADLSELDADVDVFCGYRSNNGTSGFNVEPDALQIFTALNVPFGLSVVVDSWLAQRLDETTIQ